MRECIAIPIGDGEIRNCNVVKGIVRMICNSNMVIVKIALLTMVLI